MRESDWPDGDDSLSNDPTITFAAPGPFTVDQPDYRLNGNVEATDISVLLDSLEVKDDQDWPDDGDVYVKYSVSNGATTIHGRWPASGEASMGDGSVQEMGVFAAALTRPGGSDHLVIHVEVWDGDSWFRDGDDKIGEDTFEFDSTTDFGADLTTHVEDRGGYRITFSIVACR
jgi:hypothetical protein